MVCLGKHIQNKLFAHKMTYHSEPNPGRPEPNDFSVAH